MLIMLKVYIFHILTLRMIHTDKILAIRAIKEAAFTWGDVHEKYLSAAVHFVDDFKGWTGFGSAEGEEANLGQ
jgi:hypothetical protein